MILSMGWPNSATNFVRTLWPSFQFLRSHGWFRRCRENRINTRTGNEDPDKQFYTEQLFVFEYHFHLNKSKYVSDRVGWNKHNAVKQLTVKASDIQTRSGKKKSDPNALSVSCDILNWKRNALVRQRAAVLVHFKLLAFKLKSNIQWGDAIDITLYDAAWNMFRWKENLSILLKYCAFMQ